jgi:ABC-2 type transport system permease protein
VSAALDSLRQHLRLARQFARIGVIRKSQFRVEFACQVLMDCVWYATHIALFEILFAQTRTLAGWSLGEVRVFLGFVFAADAFQMLWLGQAWHFGRELKDGRLDPLRVRPGWPVFLYFFQRFSLEAAVNAAVALAYLLWALGRQELLGAPRTWLVLPWALALVAWTRSVLTVLYSTAEFYVLHSDAAHFLNEAFTSAADRPLDVFTRRLRAFLLFAVPVGVLTWVPASLTLGRIGALEGALHSAWIAAFGLGVFRLWRAGFRRYESALS